MDGREADDDAATVDRIIAARLREGRMRRGLTLEALASRLGIRAQQVLKYEVGASRPSAGRLKAIADALDLAPAWFFPQRPALRSPSLLPDEIERLERLKAAKPDVFEAFSRLIESSLDA
jgi:transcriptional regulator with XRE-family HTH domain